MTSPSAVSMRSPPRMPPASDAPQGPSRSGEGPSDAPSADPRAPSARPGMPSARPGIAPTKPICLPNWAEKTSGGAKNLGGFPPHTAAAVKAPSASAFVQCPPFRGPCGVRASAQSPTAYSPSTGWPLRRTRVHMSVTSAPRTPTSTAGSIAGKLGAAPTACTRTRRSGVEGRLGGRGVCPADDAGPSAGPDCEPSADSPSIGHLWPRWRLTPASSSQPDHRSSTAPPKVRPRMWSEDSHR